uniref:Uncharacterized protein n=1 Tax=Anguilla anguilla TaxID=7936 RepID=A0A0E9TZJ8_ANGAN
MEYIYVSFLFFQYDLYICATCRTCFSAIFIEV